MIGSSEGLFERGDEGEVGRRRLNTCDGDGVSCRRQGGRRRIYETVFCCVPSSTYTTPTVCVQALLLHSSSSSSPPRFSDVFEKQFCVSHTDFSALVLHHFIYNFSVLKPTTTTDLHLLQAPNHDTEPGRWLLLPIIIIVIVIPRARSWSLRSRGCRQHLARAWGGAEAGEAEVHAAWVEMRQHSDE